MNATDNELLDAELANIREQLKLVAEFNLEESAAQGAELLRLAARVTALEEKLEGAAVGCIDDSDWTVTVMPWPGVLDD